MFLVLAEKRKDEIRKEEDEKDGLNRKIEVLDEELEVFAMKLEEERRLQERVVVDWTTERT